MAAISFRTSTLPWALAQDDEERFRKLFLALMGFVVVFGIALRFITLPEPNIPYDTVIHVMDAMRTGKSANGGTTVVDVDLFPAISIGDAPVRH